MRLFRKPEPAQQQPVVAFAGASARDERDQALPEVALHYRTWGDPAAGRAVLLIPGLTATHK